MLLDQMYDIKYNEEPVISSALYSPRTQLQVKFEDYPARGLQWEAFIAVGGQKDLDAKVVVVVGR